MITWTTLDSLCGFYSHITPVLKKFPTIDNYRNNKNLIELDTREVFKNHLRFKSKVYALFYLTTELNKEREIDKAARYNWGYFGNTKISIIEDLLQELETHGRLSTKDPKGMPGGHPKYVNSPAVRFVQQGTIDNRGIREWREPQLLQSKAVPQDSPFWLRENSKYVHFYDGGRSWRRHYKGEPMDKFQEEIMRGCLKGSSTITEEEYDLFTEFYWKRFLTTRSTDVKYVKLLLDKAPKQHDNIYIKYLEMILEICEADNE